MSPFGPVAPIITFRTDEEAAELANGTSYGLVAAVISRDEARAKRIADRLHVGIVHINDQTVDDAPNTPFGGIRASGTGARFGGSANLDAFTDTRWVTIRGDIAPYPFSRDNPDPDRKRKLLLHKREVAEIQRQVEQAGLTLVPMRIYFKDGLAKVELALAKGKHTYDKRHALAERDAKRDLDRAVRVRARSGDPRQ